MGDFYANGKGVPQDDSEAAKWLRKAAEQGFAEAQLALGVSYQEGNGVAKDDGQAVEWIRKAAEQGSLDAQFMLSFKYSCGEGVPEDYVEAYKWANIAAAQEGKTAENAAKLRDNVRKLMTPEQIAEGQKRAAEAYRAMQVRTAEQ